MEFNPLPLTSETSATGSNPEAVETGGILAPRAYFGLLKKMPTSRVTRAILEFIDFWTYRFHMKLTPSGKNPLTISSEFRSTKSHPQKKSSYHCIRNVRRKNSVRLRPSRVHLLFGSSGGLDEFSTFRVARTRDSENWDFLGTH